MRRSIFYQKTKSEEGSRKWLHFLEEHPDPIAIISSKSGLLFKNRDFESTLQSDHPDPLLSEHENMLRFQEQLFSLPVTCFSREELFSGGKDHVPNETITMYQLLKDQNFGNEEPNF